MKKVQSVFTKRIDQLLKLGKPTIAFGLKEPNDEILKSLKKGKKHAEIILVGPEAIKNIKGFKLVVSDKPEEKLAEMLAKDEVEGIIRGTIDDFTTYDAYKKLTGEVQIMNPALFEDPFGRQFFASPLSNPEGWEKEERLKIALDLAGYMKKEWNIEPNIAVFTGRRHDTYPKKKDIREGVNGILNKTYEDAEWIVAELKKQGYNAKNWAIDLNPAVKDGCNLLIPVNGMVGNQIFRVLNFCGGIILACPRIGLSRPYEDNSRTETDYLPHVRWVVGLINAKKEKK